MASGVTVAVAVIVSVGVGVAVLVAVAVAVRVEVAVGDAVGVGEGDGVPSAGTTPSAMAQRPMKPRSQQGRLLGDGDMQLGLTFGWVSRGSYIAK